MRSQIALLGAIGLSACSTGIDKLPGVNAPPAAQQRPAPRYTPPPLVPPANTAPGLEGVLGAQAPALAQRLGRARLDMVEGDARKLQFVGTACVLDIYLYPLFEGGEPVATHVAARLRTNGAQTDEAQCLREIEARRASAG